MGKGNDTGQQQYQQQHQQQQYKQQQQQQQQKQQRQRCKDISFFRRSNLSAMASSHASPDRLSVDGTSQSVPAAPASQPLAVGDRVRACRDLADGDISQGRIGRVIELHKDGTVKLDFGDDMMGWFRPADVTRDAPHAVAVDRAEAGATTQVAAPPGNARSSVPEGVGEEEHAM